MRIQNSFLEIARPINKKIKANLSSLNQITLTARSFLLSSPCFKKDGHCYDCTVQINS